MRCWRNPGRTPSVGGSMDVDPLFFGRIVERILVVIFGGLSLVLGWRLFMVGVVDPQIAEIKFKDWKVSLRQVGPGSVFAALGIGVMAFALSKPLTVNETARTPATFETASAPDSGQQLSAVESTRSVSYLGDGKDLRHWVR